MKAEQRSSAATGTTEIEIAAESIRSRLGGRQPSVAVVLGSGLGFFTRRIQDAVTSPYREVPGFPEPTVLGHGGELVAGQLAGKDVIAQSGRFHLYEGHPASTTALPVRVFAELGIRTLLLTNAAGGITRTFARGSVMLIADHINLTFRNPLIGKLLTGEERFPDMSDPCDPGLRLIAREVARDRRLLLNEGVYAQLLGPSFETPAEIRMLERLGADAVGMSTVLEVIAARARGVRCLAFSVVTNPAAGISPTKLNHEEVMETANRVTGELGALIEGIIGRL
ncbi:MAG TPA: purine-nucleoside phosphorylase [Gemmatimonadales bacterium]|nr:purine-nucleoside phosphorylase [Gemmatimonadales bacterium]